MKQPPPAPASPSDEEEEIFADVVDELAEEAGKARTEDVSLGPIPPGVENGYLISSEKSLPFPEVVYAFTAK